MKIDEIIKSRRSIRKFQDKPVPRALIEECIEAARLAPSACNSQPWHFNVFDEPDAKENFCKAAFSGIYSNMLQFKEAPVIIAISAAVGGNIMTRFGQMISGTKFYLIDQGICGQQLVLKAHDLGLGTCWIGWFDNKKAKKALGLPLAHQCQIIIALGYPAESPPARERKPLAEVLSYNGYK